jgi:hypothetical protein
MANRQVIKMWVDALRSGQYSQTHRTLRDEKGYCCLGVLCDLYRQSPEGQSLSARWEETFFVTEGDVVGEMFTMKKAWFLHPNVRAWAGLRSNNPPDSDTDEDKGVTRTLGFLNDTDRLSFAEIADVIEKGYLQNKQKPTSDESEGGNPPIIAATEKKRFTVIRETPPSIDEKGGQ